MVGKSGSPPLNFESLSTTKSKVSSQVVSWLGRAVHAAQLRTALKFQQRNTRLAVSKSGRAVHPRSNLEGIQNYIQITDKD
jgi:hypothetical protein